ncbi:MAG TPA: PP0621 family protein [Burkholderiaceae bacterium]|nr:PP0621 family protein [Burkholderiaceae bacterium]
MKFLVVFAVILLGVWLWRNNRKEMLQGRNDEMMQAKTRTPPKQQMVSCAHCGVHLPQSEALPSPDGLGGAPWFCSAEHRKLGALKS